MKSGEGEKLFGKGGSRYESAAGYEPKKVLNITEKLIEKAKKKDPRFFAKEPEMLWSQPVSRWLEIGVRGRPVDPLFGPFWRNGELAIMFSGTGLGKSALATQLAEGLARGVSIAPFAGKGWPVQEPRRVLYLDFELNVDQLASRYAAGSKSNKHFITPYSFSGNFIRSEFYWNGHIIDGYDGFSDMFFKCIDSEVRAVDASVLIVDNITFLDDRSTSNAGVAKQIMSGLCRLKKDRYISILVLAHTPKRKAWKAVSELDLQGSINLANFADSIFAIAPSRRNLDLRYLKQIKVRSGRLEHDASCVPVFKLGKFDNAAVMQPDDPERVTAENFLGFQFTEFAREADHLGLNPRVAEYAEKRIAAKNSLIANARSLAEEGLSSRKIAIELEIPRSTVQRYMKSE